MYSRLFTQSKKIILFTFIVIVVLILHTQYAKQVIQSYKSAHRSGERCLSELTSIKYQLNIVTEYKNRIDKLLVESQIKHEADKERFKDIMESCVAMKQQTGICQSQFEDLQSECKKVKEDYDILIKEVKLKSLS